MWDVGSDNVVPVSTLSTLGVAARGIGGTDLVPTPGIVLPLADERMILGTTFMLAGIDNVTDQLPSAEAECLAGEIHVGDKFATARERQLSPTTVIGPIISAISSVVTSVSSASACVVHWQVKGKGLTSGQVACVLGPGGCIILICTIQNWTLFAFMLYH